MDEEEEYDDEDESPELKKKKKRFPRGVKIFRFAQGTTNMAYK